MVETSISCPGARKGCASLVRLYPRSSAVRDEYLDTNAEGLTQRVCGKLTHSLQASTRGGMSLRAAAQETGKRFHAQRLADSAPVLHESPARVTASYRNGSQIPQHGGGLL